MSLNNIKPQKVKVAIIQTRNDYSEHSDKNLSIILPFIESAVKQNAELILLPELAPNKYIWHSSQWNFGETMDGYSVKWLQKHSKRLSVYIAMTFVEVDKHTLDFYNTFVMSDDNGNIISKIRKNTPCSLETFYWSLDSRDKHIFDTNKFGKIAMGICFENHFAFFENEIVSNIDSISMILMPHCVPRADPMPTIGWNKTLCDECNNTIGNISINYAKKYKIPVLFSNKCGPLNSPVPILPSFIKYNCYEMGQSKIIDYDGNIVSIAKSGDMDKAENELIIGEIEIFKQRNDEYKLNENTWSTQNYFSDFNRKAILFQGILGSIYYKCSITRRIRGSACVDANHSSVPYLANLMTKTVWCVLVGTTIYNGWQRVSS